MPTWFESQPWAGWNQSYSASTTMGIQVWRDWNTPYAATSSGTWTTAATTNTYDYQAIHYRAAQQYIWTQWQPAVVYTVTEPALRLNALEDLRAAGGIAAHSESEWAAISAENNRLAAERDTLRAVATVEARKLLAIVLSREQLASYEANRYFDVRGSEGGLFRIHYGTSGNIRQLVDGREINRLCVHPDLWDRDGQGHLPTEDCLIGQALALMHDELGAVGVANVHQGVRHLRAA